MNFGKDKESDIKIRSW